MLHRSTIDALVAPKKRPPDVDESTLSLKELREEAKLKDNIVNSFLPLASDGTLADAKDLLDKNPQCLDILVNTRRNQEWDCGPSDHECDGAKCGND